MERGRWKKPVVMEIYGRPGPANIADTVEAALMLLNGWPGKRTDMHTVAVLTCRDVLTGRSVASLARVNFIEAALDAGYHILPETFLDERWNPAAVRDQDSHSDFNLDEPVRVIAETPVGDTRSRWISTPLPVVDPPMPRRPNQEEVGMGKLLRQLAEVLGLILMEILKGTASLLNIGVHHRPQREIR